MAEGNIGTVYVEVGAKIDGLTSALKSVQEQLAKTKENTKAWGEQFKEVGQTLAVAGGAITAALTAIVYATSKAGDEFDEMSAKTGISTETLSTLKLAADKSGTSIESVSSGMKFLATQMLETSSATDKSKTVLGALGVAVTDTKGKLRPMNEVLFDVADKFKGMEAGALKTKMAVALFGRAGMDMIPILDMGSKGLKENEEAARKLGIEWSGDSSKAAAAFADSIEDLKAANVGLGKTIALSIMPSVQGFIEKVTGTIAKVREWADANPELTKSLTSLVGGLGASAAAGGTLLLTIAQVSKSLKELSLAAQMPIIITIGIIGGAALAKALEAVRDLYEKQHGNFVTEETKNWTKFDMAMGGWSNTAEAIAGEYIKLNKYSRESYKVIDELNALWKTYGFNTQKTYEAIVAGVPGTEKFTAILKKLGGVSLEAALATSGLKKEVQDTDPETAALRKRLEALIAALNNTGGAAKSLKEELGLVFSADLDKRIAQIEDALKSYKGQLSFTAEKKLREELQQLRAELSMGLPVFRDVTKEYEKIQKAAQDWLDKSENTEEHFQQQTDTLIDYVLGLQRVSQAEVMAARASSDMADAFEAAAANLEKSAKVSENAWAEACLKMAQDISRAFSSMISGTSSFADGMKSIIESMATSIGQAIGSMITDAFELTGALGKFAGTFGSLIGGIVGGMLSLFAGAFASSQTYAEQMADVWASAVSSMALSLSYLGDVSAAVAEQIINAASGIMNTWGAMAGAMGGQAMADALATTAYLNELMASTGINVYNLASYWALASQALEQYNSMMITGAQASETLNDAFSTLMRAAQELGEEGSAEMIKFIQSVRASGLEVASVTQYVQQQLGTIPDALTAMTVGATVGFEALIAQQAELQQQLASMDPNEEGYAELQAQLASVQQQMQSLAVESEDDLARVSTLTVASFNAMLASGVSWLDAVTQMSEPLAALQERYAALGLSADPALQALMDVVNVTQANQELFGAIDANKQVLDVLANSGWLTSESLQAITDNAQNYFNDLIGAGMSSDDALRAMGPTLQAIQDQAANYGLELDANTQALIDQAKALGVIQDTPVDPGTAMAEGFDRVAEVLERIATALGVGIPKAAEDAAHAIADDMGNAIDGVNAKLVNGAQDASTEWKKAASDASSAWSDLDLSMPTSGGADIPGYAGGGVAWTPQYATVAETEPEVIIPMSDYAAGTGLAANMGAGANASAGDTYINLTINAQNLDDQTIARASEKIYQAVEYEKRRWGRG